MEGDTMIQTFCVIEHGAGVPLENMLLVSVCRLQQHEDEIFELLPSHQIDMDRGVCQTGKFWYNGKHDDLYSPC